MSKWYIVLPSGREYVITAKAADIALAEYWCQADCPELAPSYRVHQGIAAEAQIVRSSQAYKLLSTDEEDKVIELMKQQLTMEERYQFLSDCS